MLALRSVEVNDVEALETESLKLLCLSYRVLVVYLFAVIVTFCQTYTLAVYKVYGWDEFNHLSNYFINFLNEKVKNEKYRLLLLLCLFFYFSFYYFSFTPSG